MAVVSRLLPLFAYSTFAVFLVVLMATPTNALTTPHAHAVRDHGVIAKRRRDPMKRAKRCRPKTTSPAPASAAPSTTQAPSSSPPAYAPPTTTSKPKTTSSTHTSTSVPTTSASTGSTSTNSSKKLLLAWPNGETNLEKFAYGTRVAGMYTWSPFCPANLHGVDCSQQLWGFKQESQFVQQVGDKPSSLIFGFNEPDQSGQANMSPQDAATLWNSRIKPLKAKGAKLVSPATTSAPAGKTWMQNMLKACGGDCGWDYLAIHWYGTSADECKAYVNDMYKTFGKPIIISEYACQNFAGGAQCTQDQTNTFHYTMGAWFDQTDYVFMYAPFGFMPDMGNVNPDNQLMGSDGGPNPLGKWYLFH